MFDNAVTVARSTLYFHQWKYVLTFHLPEASFLRVLDHDRIDQTVSYRNEWIAQRGVRDVVAPATRKILHEACDYLLTRAHPYKKVVYGNGIWLYTNHLTDFEDIGNIPTGKVLCVNQAEIAFAPGVVTLKDPQHAFRTYFRERWLDDNELSNLRRYFQTREGMFRTSPGFAHLINGRRMWLAANYFVDHNEPNADFLINMVVPNVVKKTLPIVGRAK